MSCTRAPARVQQGITTVGQVRMGANVEAVDTNTQLFEDQSPIYHVQNIKTPFMILQGGETARWTTGGAGVLQCRAAAGQAGDPAVVSGRAAPPRERDNQKDFKMRMKQFFDHYLKGKPAPKWMTDGVPQMKKGGPIR